MARTTCSGLQWSPWELDGVASVVPDFYRSKVSLAPHLAQALALADLRAEALGSSMGDEDAWEDEPRVLSRPPTPSCARRAHSLRSRGRPPLHCAPLTARSALSLHSQAFLRRLHPVSNDAKTLARRLAVNAPAWPPPRLPCSVHRQRRAT
jgi:hypothetical protein